MATARTRLRQRAGRGITNLGLHHGEDAVSGTPHDQGTGDERLS